MVPSHVGPRQATFVRPFFEVDVEYVGVHLLGCKAFTAAITVGMLTVRPAICLRIFGIFVDLYIFALG